MIECISLKTGEQICNPLQTVLALGTFDGVHLAHQALLRETRAWRDACYPEAAVGVFCFRDLPSNSLREHAVGHLCTNRERLDRFAECGMEFAIMADFSDLRAMDPDDYVKEFLIGECHCVAAACGYNHRFGKGGVGTSELLQTLLEGRLLVKEQVLCDGEAVSSTRIRSLLAEGDVERAAKLLGRAYTLTSTVEHGKALGRKMGVPTVNQSFPAEAALPRFGVYAVSCTVEGKRYYGVANVGVRPTVDHHAAVNCETYLIDFRGDLYGQSISVSFLRFLRGETKFSSIHALTEQIRTDIQSVRALIAEGTLQE